MKASSTPMLLRSFLAATLAWSTAVQSFDIEERIVGGDEAEPGDYPYFGTYPSLESLEVPR